MINKIQGTAWGFYSIAVKSQNPWNLKFRGGLYFVKWHCCSSCQLARLVSTSIAPARVSERKGDWIFSGILFQIVKVSFLSERTTHTFSFSAFYWSMPEEHGCIFWTLAKCTLCVILLQKTPLCQNNIRCLLSNLMKIFNFKDTVWHHTFACTLPTEENQMWKFIFVHLQ